MMGSYLSGGGAFGGSGGGPYINDGGLGEGEGEGEGEG
jgi:hypothetical protein